MGEFGFMLRGIIDKEKENAPTRKFQDGERVIGTEEIKGIERTISGYIKDGTYGPRKSLLRDFGWLYTVIDDENDFHYMHEEKLTKDTQTTK